MHKGLEETGFNKPLITSYVPSYNPENDPAERVNIPWAIDFDRMTEEGHVLFRPRYIDHFEKHTEPIKAKFYSAHFAFARGEFCEEVPHDPELYFTGEEMNITLRAYTHGYDLFHPHIVVAWHEYTRKNRVKQWDDDKDWWKKDKHSKIHYKQFIEHPDNHKYGLGCKRNVQDYMTYAKINIFLEKEKEDDQITITEKEKEEEEKKNDQITITEKEEEEKEKKYKNFDQSWRNWINENNALGITKEVIINILLKADFGPDEIEKEYNNI